MTENTNINAAAAEITYPTFEETVDQYYESLEDWRRYYFKHTTSGATYHADDFSDAFLTAVAANAAEAKTDLRNLLRKSPCWNEEKNCLIINGNRTHEPDEGVLAKLFYDLVELSPKYFDDDPFEQNLFRQNMVSILNFFIMDENREYQDEYGFDCTEKLTEAIETINYYSQKAYKKGKKKSRVFAEFAKSIGIYDNTAGSKYQRLFAQFADELNAKKIPYKFILSINPAHFLSMSNPKFDDRGQTMISCHSMNSNAHPFNNGCAGYACDPVTMIGFTVKDFDDEESWLNRKTSRQLFFYKPGNGALLQSRYYGENGGSYQRVDISADYRHLVQYEIAAAEGVPNLWKTSDYDHYDSKVRVFKHEDFGGYADWLSGFDPRLSILKGYEDTAEDFTVGASGYCIICGDKYSDGLVCGYCNGEYECGECGCFIRNGYDLIDAYHNGCLVEVCEQCLDRYYRYCEDLDEYHHEEDVTYIDTFNVYIPDTEVDNYYVLCDICGRWERVDDIYCCDYDDIHICERCYAESYECCDIDGSIYDRRCMIEMYDYRGNEVWVYTDNVDRAVDRGYEFKDEETAETYGYGIEIVYGSVNMGSESEQASCY